MDLVTEIKGIAVTLNEIWSWKQIIVINLESITIYLLEWIFLNSSTVASLPLCMGMSNFPVQVYTYKYSSLAALYLFSVAHNLTVLEEMIVKQIIITNKWMGWWRRRRRLLASTAGRAGIPPYKWTIYNFWLAGWRVSFPFCGWLGWHTRKVSKT